MTTRHLASVSLAFSFLYCMPLAWADNPVPAVREPLAFKDLTPPPVHDDHGKENGEKHVTCGCEEPAHGGLFGTVEYLLLRPRRGAFDFAISDANRDLVPSGTLQSLNYELRSGVRAGLGYRFGSSHWDAAFEYTYFRSGADTTIGAPPGGTLYATLTRAGLNDEATSASADASLEYNVFDAVMGRRVHLDEHAAIRFYGGFRFATIRQDFEATYNGGVANVGRVSTSSNFDGFGPVIGGDATVNLHGGFHLYARGHAALMTGSLDNPMFETNNAGQTLYSNLNYSTQRVIPVLGMAIGGGWQRDGVFLRAGYEITNWFGMIDSPRFTGELSEGKFILRNGNLSLEGLFVQAGVSY